MRNYVLIALVGSILLLEGCSKEASPPQADRETAPSGLVNPEGAVPYAPQVIKEPLIPLEDTPRLGNPDAKVGIVEFSDYQCPFCRRFYLGTAKQLKKKYVESGKVQYYYKDFPLKTHDEAVPAALAARCAGKQDNYWVMQQELFMHQDRLGLELYGELMRKLKLNSQAFVDCMNNSDTQHSVYQDMLAGIRAGVNSTPTFMLGIIEGNSLRVKRVASGTPGLQEFDIELKQLLK